jgi:hypothetical protein
MLLLLLLCTAAALTQASVTATLQSSAQAVGKNDV